MLISYRRTTLIKVFGLFYPDSKSVDSKNADGLKIFLVVQFFSKSVYYVCANDLLQSSTSWCILSILIKETVLLLIFREQWSF